MARLESAVTADGVDGRVARLERVDLIRRGTVSPPPELALSDPPEPRRGGSVLEALGAALVAAEGRPEPLTLLSLDERLVEATRRESVLVLDLDQAESLVRVVRPM